MRLSISVHGMLLIGSVLCFVTLAITGWFAWERNRTLTYTLQVSLENITGLQASAIGDAVWNLNRETAREILEGNKVNPDFHSARVILKNNSVFAEISGPNIPESRQMSRQAPVIVKDQGVDQVLGHVEVTVSTERLINRQLQAFGEALGIGLIQLAAVLLGTWLVLRRIIHPLEQIQNNLVSLSHGQTNVDIPARQRQDQIGDLAKAVENFRDSLVENKRLQAEESERAKELEIARNIAENANRAKSEFLSSMSHELRTPLNSILGFGQLLETDTEAPLNEEQKDSVDRIVKSGMHLLELINDVLDFAKIEASKIVFSLESVPVNAIIEDSLKLVQAMAEERGIEISKADGFADDTEVIADYTRLKQSLLNLMSNAVKYNREGGYIFLSQEKTEEENIRISITDTGKGIHSDDLENLFEPFNRLAAETSTIEGAGIGLTITRQIIEKMGGTVGVTSTVGQGSTFWLELPLGTGNGIPHEAKADVAETKVERIPADERTILYVEDNPDNLKLMEGIIKRLPGYSLLAAHNAMLGIELAKTRLPDLIILDINMPGMDGFAALKELQDLKATQDIPVIGLSANAMPRDITRGLEAGFLRYLTKPVQVNEVFEVIDSLAFSQPQE